MTRICENFAKLEHLKFSTNVDPIKSKTKCIVFSPRKKDRTNVAPIILDLLPYPWYIAYVGEDRINTIVQQRLDELVML